MQKTENISSILEIKTDENGSLRVNSREKVTLEFKTTIDENQLRKCMKTIAAFANTSGGSIIFGVSDSPRKITGIKTEDIPDESALDNLLKEYLSPVPTVEMREHKIGGMNLLQLIVEKKSKPPIIAAKDLHTKGDRSKLVLSQGCIYFRRAGKTFPASGPEFQDMMERRDDIIRKSIFILINHIEEYGYENVAIADLSKSTAPGDGVRLYVPEEAARNLNVVDRGKLVTDNGAPAYEIKGSISISSFSDKDPRKPLLPKPAARALKSEIEKIFWKELPWTYLHLNKAATHLGHWNQDEGDGKNTSVDELTKRKKYLEKGRLAVLSFARNKPDEFIDVVASQKNKSHWNNIKADRE